MPAVSSKTPTECSQILFYLFQVSSNPFKVFCNTLNCACLQIWDLSEFYWFTRCCCLSAAPCLCLLPRQSQRWVAALNLKCISTSKALGIGQASSLLPFCFCLPRRSRTKNCWLFSPFRWIIPQESEIADTPACYIPCQYQHTWDQTK